MTDLILKCDVCGALLDEDDLFCVNCGRESPGAEQAGERRTVKATYNFTCENCGASMSYDPTVQALRCPFCSSEKLHAEKDARVLAPEIVVPLEISKDEAIAQLRKFMGSSFWRPSDLSVAAVVTRTTPVFVPYWVFSADTQTYWTADSSRVPLGANASWCPVSGEHAEHYDGVLVGASGTLTPAETRDLGSYDLARGVPLEEFDLDHVVYEPFRVQKKYARSQAIAGFEEAERTACRALVPGNARNIRVAVKLSHLSARPMLLPVWIMAYQYQDRSYRFLVNGQTGRSVGDAPFSYMKLAMVVIFVVCAFLLFLGCIGVLASR